MNTGAFTATWRVKSVLDAHNLSAYRLAQELSGKVSRNSVYAIAAGTAKRADLETLGELVEALRNLTGDQELTVGDLLAYGPNQAQA